MISPESGVSKPPRIRKQCGLAAAGFTGDAEYLVIVDLKVQVVKDVNVTVDELVRSGQIFDFLTYSLPASLHG